MRFFLLLSWIFLYSLPVYAQNLTPPPGEDLGYNPPKQNPVYPDLLGERQKSYLKIIDKLNKRNFAGREWIDSPLKSLIIFSILSSNDLSTALINTQKAKLKIEEQFSTFDPSLILGASYNNNANISSIDTENESSVLNNSKVTALTASMIKRFQNGMSLELDFERNQIDSESNLYSLNSGISDSNSSLSYFSSTIDSVLTIPLLKGSGDINTLNIELERENQLQSEYRTKQLFDAIATNIGKVFYDTKFLINSYIIQLELIEVSKQSLEDAKARYRLGAIDQISLLQSKNLLDLEELKAREILFNILTFENIIKSALKLEFLPQGLFPVEDDITYPDEYDIEEVKKEALASNIDLKILMSESKKLELTSSSLKNQLEEQVDLKFNVGLNGYGLDDGQALENMTKADVLDYGVGIFWTIPLGKRKSRVSYYVNELEKSENQALVSTTSREVRLNAGESLRKIKLLEEEVKSRETAVELNRTLVERELVKLNLGQSTSLTVNQVQNQLKQAQLSLLQSRVNHLKEKLSLEIQLERIYNYLAFRPSDLLNKDADEITEFFINLYL